MKAAVTYPKNLKPKEKRLCNNDDEDSNDNLMDLDSNATEELAEESNEKAVKVC